MTTPSESATALAIDVRGLRKSYGDKVAVESLDMQVVAGTVVGFLGPNGAGKTTVIRILSTLLAPDRGTFAVASVSSSNPVEIRRRIGVLPESAGYPPAQTSEEWLCYHAQLFGASRTAARETALRLLAEVGLADRSRSRIANLSRGMRQRLGIARALVNDPSVVFLDEPTLGLDPRGQQQVLDLVARIAGEHSVTVVLSTHTLAEVEQVCSRVMILNRGRLVADGTVAEVVRSAAAPRSGVLVVPAELRQRAIAVLAAQRIPATAASRPDEIGLTLPVDATIEQSSTAALNTLLAADVPVLGLAFEGGRLSDAFLAVTEGANDD
ncbi:MAG TPA: ABC transporter ATP-binding protein [Nocardioidaceae bacterium]|nr:ABC transporter ATP-binding protein [Nocardioidaceae bacterium]